MNVIQKKTADALQKTKKKYNYDKDGEIRIKTVPSKNIQALHNIADHIGVDFSAFMKTEIRKIIDSYPEKYLQPISDF